MRQPNFKLGWFIPQQIAALTHFHTDVTTEDFMGVIQTGQALLQSIDNEFHVIIDNRFVAMSELATLVQMQQMVPYMNHPGLRWVVVVKPEGLDIDTNTLAIEQAGNVQLKNVASLSEAIGFLQSTDTNLNWAQLNSAFFPE